MRQNNEDSLLVGEGRDTSLFVVADGIGGFEAGEVASSIAVETLKELGPEESFDDTIQEANRRILSAARDNDKLSGMGTTVVAIRFGGTDEEPAAEIAHVGDSRGLSAARRRTTSADRGPLARCGIGPQRRPDPRPGR